MPKVEITLKDGSNKVVEFENNFTDDDVDEVAGELNSKLLQGGVSQNYTQNWDNKGRVYYTDENGNRVKPDSSLNAFQRFGRNIKAKATNFNSWLNETNPDSEAYKQKVNTLLTLETLPMGAGKAATQWGASKLMPFMGKKIGQSVAEGIGAGAVSGGVYGTGNALIEKENPIIGGLAGMVGGGLTGGLFNGVLGNIVKGVRAGKLRNHKSLNNMTQEEIKALRNNARGYYNDYIKGTSVYRDDLGKINFGNAGIDEQVSKGLHNAEVIPDLKKQIKTGTKQPNPRKDYEREDIEQFHIINNDINNKNMEYQIAEDINGNKYYFAKDVTNSDIEPSQWGVADIDSDLNKQIAEQINKNVLDQRELLQEYKGVHSDMVKKYGSIENLKAKAVSDMEQHTKYGVKSEAIDDYRNLLAYEDLLQGANYVENNIKSSATREAVDNKVFPQKIKNGSNKQPSGVVSEPLNNELPPTNRNQHPASETTHTNIINDVEENINLPTSGEYKISQLAQNAELPKNLKNAVRNNAPEYEILHNNDLIASAKKEIVKDPSSRLARLDNMTSKNDPLSAQDFEEARQLVGKLYQEGRIDEALALTQKISIAGSKAGQSVQAMSLWAKTTPEGAVRQAQKIIDEYNKTARKKLPNLTEEQAKTIMDMAQNIQEFGDNAGREKDVATGKLLKYFADLVPQTAGNKFKTVRNISLLLNPKTFMRNITGNAIFAGMENGVTKPIAALIDGVVGSPKLKNATANIPLVNKLFTGKRTRVMPQFEDYGKGLIKGFKEGAEDVDLGIDTRGIGGRFDLPQSRSFENTPVLGGLEKALDYSLRVPDRSFYEAAFQESLANQMKAAGVEKATNEMLENASLEALESVYQNSGKLADTVLNLRRGLNNIGVKDFGLGDALVPYAQTPANVAQQGINYSPLGIINAIKSGLQGNQRQATLDAARAITGTGIIGTGYGLSRLGAITPETDDFQIRKNYEALGERPNQIRLPDGSLMSYTQLQPLAAPLSGGAILGDLQDGDYMAALDKSIGSIADLSMLRGLNDFTSTYNDKGIASALMNTVTNVPSQFIGSGINQINAYVDPYQRETYDPNPLIQSLNQARAKTPLLSKTLPKKYDVTGSEIEKYNSKGLKKAFDVFVNPVFVNKPKDDLVLQKVAALTENTGEKGGLFLLPEKKIKLDDGTTKQLSGREFSEYSKVLGEVTYQGYQKMMNTPRYANADDQTRLKLLTDIRKNAKAITQEELFGKKNKYSAESSIQRKVENRLNKGQNKINRILSKMDSQLVDQIMYKEE